ncbi:phosphate ABC transporter substrate-binding protein PstS [Kineosporia sp. R_H_3]|uniref:phosphate ABC transporter substrate-binding protein PstS n=1 Tax=Kineosporia sp. R_H_3 TaxID=1961848 RepID=UPI000B4A7033|nr:phosphate ABC transporter substrate-binding protein PstS [Kineosporia sp. R_H_3]
MKLTLPGRVAGLSLVAALALTACGSDNTTGDSTPSAADSAASSGPALSGTLNGEGSSAQKNAIGEVISGYQSANPGVTVNYNATGSGAGIKQFLAGQVDFAGTDSALKSEEKDGVVETEAAKTRCGGNDAWNLPLVAGPIAITYNLPGVDKLVLTPSVASQMFLGKITKWNDPKIAALNSGATLPATDIKVFYRADESGTTENFTKYLNGSAPADWAAEPAKVWPGTTGEGRPQTDGVAQGVKSTEGGLSYMEWSAAKDNQLGVAQVDNGAGAVALTGETAGKAVAAAAAAGEGNDLKLKLDYAVKDAGTYPIVLVTYEVVCSKGLAADKTALVKSFLTYFASPDTQKGLEEIGYAPLPEDVRGKVVTAINAIS